MSTEIPRHVFGSTGVAVPKVGLGTWYLEQSDSKLAIAAVRAGLDLGLTHVDTAELYGSGAAESLVGEALEGRRDGVFLVSKIIPSNASRKGTVKHCEQTSSARFRWVGVAVAWRCFEKRKKSSTAPAGLLKCSVGGHQGNFQTTFGVTH
jgi:aryl-alcohol dehydrogenase-like predicted oxidoreductase